MSASVSAFRLISMGIVPFVDDDEAESVQQNTPKLSVQLIRMLRWNQADLAGKTEIEESDFAVPPAPGRIGNDCAGNGFL